MRWLLLVLLTIAGCSPSAPPPPTTPTPATSAARWTATFGEATRVVTITADGQVHAEGKLVGNIPPPELQPFERAVQAPEMVALKLDTPPGEHVMSLAWSAGGSERRWSWPAEKGELPKPLALTVDALEKAQASMMPAGQ